MFTNRHTGETNNDDDAFSLLCQARHIERGENQLNFHLSAPSHWTLLTIVISLVSFVSTYEQPSLSWRIYFNVQMSSTDL